MDWLIKNVTRRADAEYSVAGQLALLIKHGTPDVMWDSVHIKVKYTPTSDSLYIHLDPWYMTIDEHDHRISLSKYISGSTCAAWDIDSPIQEWSTIEIGSTSTSVTISVNGQSFIHQSVDSIPMTSIRLHFPEGAKFCDPEICVSEIAPKNIWVAKSQERKALEMTVDFYDDLHLAAFDQEMLDEMFRIMAGYKTSRAYWIHHGNRKVGGAWENSVASANMQKTFDTLGDDYLVAAVKAAHKSGIPLIGIFKPFDTTMCHYTHPLRAGQGESDALGGKLNQMLAFPVEHSELCMRRRTVLTQQARPARIVIRSRKSIPGDAAQNIQIYVSRDNAEYSLYQGTLHIEVADYEIRLNSLEIKEDFVMIVFAPLLAAQIQNTLPLLAKVFDALGNALECTFGITPRLKLKAEYHLDQHPELLDFRQHGINFDCAGDGMPSANLNPDKIRFDLFSPQQSHGLLGLAMNSNAQVPGVLSEAEPEAQQWWLSMIEEMLDAEVDGVEIRPMNHSNVMDWQQYGFNQPIVDEYQRRYGVDMTHQEYSREKLRRLRGDFFTDFLRKASTMVRARGKKFHLHIEDMRQGTAADCCPMEIEMQWRRWIGEKLCDGVTLKAVNFGSHDTAFGRELLAACATHEIPVSFAPFIHSPFMTNTCQEMLEYAMSGSFDAFNVYEFASLFAFAPDGTVSHINEAILDWLKSYPWRNENQPQKNGDY